MRISDWSSDVCSSDLGDSTWEGEDGRGFIAPFRAQATLSGTLLPADFVNDTVHKFQGRECDEIVFSTVLDKKSIAPKLLTFVDDPRMVNVRSEEHTSELQSLMRISYAVFCLKKKT